jgi:vacuolar-type H+-ATPase subunit I/STV1
MKKSLIALAVVLVLTLAPSAFASGPGERYDHFKGKVSETLPEAVQNFSEYNTKLEAILNREIDDNALHEVHELTYTLENALQKINEELAALAEKLEEVHVASERMDRDAVLRHGRDYLRVSRQIVK